MKKPANIPSIMPVLLAMGIATFIEEPSAKIEALQIMMNKFAFNKAFFFTEGDVKPIIVIKIEVHAYMVRKH